MGDPLRVLGVAADVVLVEEGLRQGGGAKDERVTRLIREKKSRGNHEEVRVAPHLLVSGDASVHGGVDDSVQAHAERVDVAVMLPVLVLADQGAQLLGLILHHVNGVLQGAHLHLAGRSGGGKNPAC